MTLPNENTSTALYRAILSETHDALYPLAPYSDSGTDYAAHLGWGLLAVLWGKVAPEENIDYWDAGLPQALLNSDENTHRVFYWDQQHVMHTVWGSMAAIIAYHSPLLTVTALLAQRESFLPILHVAEHWETAEDIYGTHPDGFTVGKEHNIYVITVQR